MFRIEARDRAYDHHRPDGCTALVIEVDDWPGNEFGLWLPETVYCEGEIAWCNWEGETTQTWERSGDAWTWSKSLDGVTITSTLRADAGNRCLWYAHSFENLSEREVSGLSTATCFHLVDAPEFVSIRGERIWACLDDEWTTTDRVPRHQSPDPRRVGFLRKGVRTERTVVPSEGFPSAIMPQAACHPLMIAERFGTNGSVGIACRSFERVFNNNDCILRCVHSEPFSLNGLPPGERAEQEGVILFSRGGHCDLVAHFEELAGSRWAGYNAPLGSSREAGSRCC